MVFKKFLCAISLPCILCPVPASAEVFSVDQKGRAFSVKRLNIQAGDSINFSNSDPFSHNVFSLSKTQSFDLGSYPQGQSKNLVFKTKGLVEVECAIHPEMNMVIEVR